LSATEINALPAMNPSSAYASSPPILLRRYASMN